MALLAIQSIQPGLTLVSFYANRAQIERELCVNRFSSISTCHGSCYLKKQLKETSQNEEAQIPLQLLISSTYFQMGSCSVPEPIYSELNSAQAPTYVATLPLVFLDGVFRPPSIV